MRLMQCGCGNLIRSTYCLWDRILTLDEGILSAKLLLSAATPWADLDSHMPFEGRVDFHVKEPTNLRARVPEWVAPGQAAGAVNSKGRDLTFEGRYACVGAVKPQDVVTLTFPIAERVHKETIMGIDLEMTIKGNDVVSMDPPGRYYPFHRRRERCRQDAASRVSRQRYVPSRELHWRQV